MTQPRPDHVVRCVCGEVECHAAGPVIGTAVCYCDDCQAAARQIEALPGAAAVADPDGGTALSLFHQRRFAVVRGADRVVPQRLRDESPTYRMVATCCNSALYLGFDRGPYWVSVLRNRFVGELPPIEFRHMTRYRTSTLPYPDTAPQSSGFAPRFIARTIGVGLRSLVGLYRLPDRT